MGKITKTASSKHDATLSPALSEFIKATSTIPLYQLPGHIANFPKQWPFPRGDLYHWIPALNRFDDILEHISYEYDLHRGPQTQPFTRKYVLRGDNPSSSTTDDILDGLGLPLDADRFLIEQVLLLSRLLIENCGNRSLYSSSSHITNLLNTSSLSLLDAALRLGLRLAQRYSETRLRSGAASLPAISDSILATHYQVDLKKIESIALPFVKSVEASADRSGKDQGVNGISPVVPAYATDLLSIVQEQQPSEARWRELGQPWMSYTADSPSTGSPFASSPSGPPVSAEASAQSSSDGSASERNARHGLSTKPEPRLLELSPKQVSSAPLYSLASKYLTEVPDSLRYSLFNRMRNAKALTESVHSRQEIVCIRLLALANLCHIQSEESLLQCVLQYETDQPRRSQLPYLLCDLIHPPGTVTHSVPKKLQSIAMALLEALTNHKSKAAEVSAALGANVNHGVLTYITRKAVNELESEPDISEDLEDTEWRESLFGLLHTLPRANHRAGEGFVSAGLIDPLVKALQLRTPKAELNHPRTLNFLDVFVYNTRDAFNALVNAHGLDAISDLLAHEVVTSMSNRQAGRGFPDRFKTQMTDYGIAFNAQQTLRAIFKVVKNMMAINGGPFDRLLRNLIESSQLLSGLKTVIENPQMYGSNIWSRAVEIFSSFIHSEPTSYAAIAEAGLTKAFLQMVTIFANAVPNVEDPHASESTGATPDERFEKAACSHILPNAEVIAAVPQAFGAICLHEAGMQQFQQSSALELFFLVLTLKPYVQALANAPEMDVSNLGSAFDELARHHPRLKSAINNGLFELTRYIGMAILSPDSTAVSAKLFIKDSNGQVVPDYSLKKMDMENYPHFHDRRSQVLEQNMSRSEVSQSNDAEQTRDNDQDVAMADVNNSGSDHPADISMVKALVGHYNASENGRPGPSPSERIAVVSTFLSGFFHNPSHCSSFADLGGIEWLVDIATALSLPHDFGHRPACQKMTKLMQTFVEHKPHLTVPLLVDRAQEALSRLHPLLEHSTDTSFFSPFLDSSNSEVKEGNPAIGQGTITIKMLLVVQNVCHILSRSFSGPNNRNNPVPFSMINLTDIYTNLIDGLGKLQIRCVWESMLALETIPSEWIKPRDQSQQLQPADNANPALDFTEDGFATTGSVMNAESTQSILFGQSTQNQTSESAASQLSQKSSEAFQKPGLVEKGNFLVIRVVLHHVPIEIASCFATFSKAVLPRRLPSDGYQKQNTILLADHIAKSMVNLLNCPVSKCLSPKTANFFRMISVSLVTQAQTDKRPDAVDRAGPQLLTLVVQQFQKCGGVEAMGEITKKLFEDSLTEKADDDQESKARGIQFAVQGLLIVMRYFSTITNSRAVNEAHQTSALTSRTLPGDRDRLEQFTIPQFLVEMRYQVLRSLLPLWNAEGIEKSRANVISLLCNIMQNILESTAESGALQRKDKPVKKAKSERRPWRLRAPDKIDQLVQKGYNQDEAREALYRCNESITSAVEYCESRTRNPLVPRLPIPASDAASIDSMPSNHQPGSSSAPHGISGVEGSMPAYESAQPENHEQPADQDEEASNLIHRFLNSEASGLGSSDSDLRLDSALSPEPGTPAPINSAETKVEEYAVLTLEDLDELRTEVRGHLVDRCLNILHAFDSLSFVLADLIMNGTVKLTNGSATQVRQDIVETLVQSLLSMKENKPFAQGSNQIAACAHLLGIILQDKDFFEAARENLQDNFSFLSEFILIRHDPQPAEKLDWIQNVLLILERILAEDAQPHQIRWTPPNQDQTYTEESPAEAPSPLISHEDKESLFSRLLDILPRIGKNATLGVAVSRVLVSLTRSKEIAAELQQKRNMQRLFLMVKQLSGIAHDKFRSAIMLILRHMVEDENTIRAIMRNDIDDLFGRQSRPIDTTTYTRHLYHDALRAPDIFVEITSEMVMLPRFDRGQNPQVLARKPKASELKADEAEASLDVNDSSIDQESSNVEIPESAAVQDSADKGKQPVETKTLTVENPDAVVQFLLFELLAYKDVDDKMPTQESADNRSSDQVQNSQSDVDMTSGNSSPSTNGESSSIRSPDANTGKKEFKAEDHPIFMYRCFILQSLTELLQSYKRSKVTFINFSRKADPVSTTPLKPRSGVLNYILTSLIPTMSLVPAGQEWPQLMKSSTSDWACNVIKALCSQTSEHGSSRSRETSENETDQDLVFVQKFVLEQALKAFKDAVSSSEPPEISYCRIKSLAFLFNSLLAPKQSPDPGRYGRSHTHHDRHSVPSQKNIAKIMFEKNFLAALTSAISEIDMSVPHANNVVKHLLSPMKLLTHTAIDLSTSSESSISPGQADSDEISSATSVSDHQGGSREETPDLFRHSTLGMFEPGRQDRSSSGSDEDEDDDDDDDDEEMYGDDYADDMEYDEEDQEHEDDVVSDEEDDLDGVGHVEGLPGEVNMDVEVDLRPDGEDNNSSDDDDEDDDDSSHEDHEIEVMEDVTGDDENESLGAQDHDDEEDWQDDEGNGEDYVEGDEDGDAALDMDEDHLISAGDSRSESAAETYDDGVLPVETIGDDMALEVGEDHQAVGEEESDEDEAEEEEDEYDDDEMAFTGPDYDEYEEEAELSPYIWGWPGPRRRHSHHHRHHFHPMLHSDRLIMPGFRSTRPSGSSQPVQDGINPLLNRTSRPNVPDNAHSAAQRSALRRMQLDFDIGTPGGPGFSPGDTYRQLAIAADSYDPLSAVSRSAVSNLLHLIGQNGPLQIGPHTHHGGLAFTMRGPMPSGGFHIHSAENRGDQSSDGIRMPLSVGANPWSANDFLIEPTDRRWQEDARMLFGPSHAERSQRIINSVLKLLVPPAIEAEKRRRAEQEELNRKIEEDRAREQAEREAKEEQERKERESQEAREVEERARTDQEAARVASESAANHVQQEERGQGSENDQPEAMEGVEPTQAPQEESYSVAQEPEPAQRVFTNIRGRELDITDLGIDLTYLEALPEEMREEVIMQQYAERRSNAAAAGGESSAISTEFLNALPPDIRAELLQQEAQDRRRREREEARRNTQESAGAPQPDDLGPADFIASLDPVLRQTILAESDEDMLATLPPEVVAEARALGGHHRRRGIGPNDTLGNLMRRSGEPLSRHRNEVKTQRRPIVQMLDKAGVSTLLRLMFVNGLDSGRRRLDGILVNVCGNRQTRGDVVNGLLSILQEGSTDVHAIERCFNQLTLRAKQNGALKTPSSAKKPQPSIITDGRASPQTVIGNCLEALVYLTQSIPHIPHFFLTEHETLASSRYKSKGKGKLRDSARYPLVTLLTLLDRDLIVKNAINMEQLAGLLANITQPLHAILKKDKERVEQQPQPEPARQDESPRRSEGYTAENPAADQLTSQNAGQELTAQHETTAEARMAENTNETSVGLQVETSPAEGSSGGGEIGSKRAEKQEKVKTARNLQPPDVSAETLRPVVNILTARECSSKAFRDTLSTLTNLSAIPHAMDAFGQELINQARQLSQSVQSSLLQLTKSLSGVESEMEAQSLALTNFSPNDSDQVKLNRVLTALDYLYETVVTLQGKDQTELHDNQDLLAHFYEDSSFMDLWQKLSACLSATKRSENNYFFNVATILLPLIETLMVVCKRMPLKQNQTSSILRDEAASPQAPPTGMRGVFFNFTNQHKKILNDLVRHSPKLMSGSFSVLVKNSSVLEFDNKRNFFSRRLHQRNGDIRHHPHPTLQLNVSRDLVFFDSYKCLHFKKPEEIKYGRFNIRFNNEEGVDAGGVTREWFQVLARQMFNPDYALFNPVASDRTTFHPNPLSSINQEHLEFFKFIGRIIGKALYENRVLDCHFSRAVYKKILGIPVSMKDMETVDLEYTKNMEWMLSNDITDIITETFSVAQDNFGVVETVDLIPNGRNIPVTEENKQEYVRLVIEYRLTGSVQKQLDSFLRGFHDIVPPELISIFDEGELELLISGMPDVDVDDWKANTEYHNYNASSPQIQWFWRAVRSFDKEERARLLQFVTGAGKVPLNGFKELEGMNGFTRFSIHRDYGPKDRLPSSHTCFNQLDLPEYDAYEALRRGLYVAMTTGNEYFGYA